MRLILILYKLVKIIFHFLLLQETCIREEVVEHLRLPSILCKTIQQEIKKLSIMPQYRTWQSGWARGASLQHHIRRGRDPFLIITSPTPASAEGRREKEFLRVILHD